jgi:plasmid replication initiation protein
MKNLPVKKSNNLTVVKSNDLIEASYYLTLAEQRVILACVSKIQPEKDIDKVHFEVSAQELVEIMNLPNKEIAYKVLKEAVDKLAERWVTIDIPDPKNKYSKYKTRWVSGIAYEDDASIRLTFAYDILPFLSQLNGQFTQYKLLNVSKFTSIYAIRLYELLMQWQTTGTREIEIEWLKNRFDVPKSYSRMFDLKKRVIDPAIDQINKYSDLWVAYGQKKRGRKITHFIFEFGLKEEKPKKKLEKPDLISKNGYSSSKDPVLEALIYHGIEKTKAETYLRKKGEENILKAIKLYEQRINEGRIAVPNGGYLIKLIEGNAGQSTYQIQHENIRKMTLLEYCRLPENHQRTTGKSDSELIVMMRKDGIQIERY